MIECSQCGWSTEKDLDLWGKELPICNNCGSSDLNFLREESCKRICCLNCDRFREMIFSKIDELVEERVEEILREGTDYHR